MNSFDENNILLEAKYQKNNVDLGDNNIINNNEKYDLNDDEINEIIKNIEDELINFKSLKSNEENIKYIDKISKKIISILKVENITSNNLMNIINILVDKIEK